MPGPLYSAQNSLLVDNLRAVLEQEGIACEVRNRLLAPLGGAIPTNEAWPELWLLDESRREEAERLVATALSDAPTRPEAEGAPWVCPRCGESNPSELSECWQCTVAGAPAPEGSAGVASPQERTLWRPVWVVVLLALLFAAFILGVR